MRLGIRFRPLLALAAILLAVPPAAAQYEADNDGLRQEADNGGIQQTVARIAWFEGDVSFNRGDDPDDWQLASINYPMALGDRLWASSNARAELQMRGATVYLAPESELGALNLNRDVRQLSLSLGTATFRIRSLERDEVFEVATPNVSVTFETPGNYRIDVDEDGNSRVSIYQGKAWAAAAGGQVALDRGDQIRVQGLDRPDYDLVGLSRSDSWDRWVEMRARRFRNVRSASYVHPDIYGAEDLDAYGSWETDSSYGAVWFPRVTGAGWEPYREGRWIWRDPWGWTWVSSEPWGWAPYHYGRWAFVRSRWCWVPVGRRDPYPGYAPALVGFIGGGSGWSISVSAGGFVGWFPLGPREPFIPWWLPSRSRQVVTGFRYAYQSRVTIVSRNAFVSGVRVDRDFVRDPRIVRQISSSPVLHGPIPVLPTRDSIRMREVRVDGRETMRPPERIGQREVVTRIAPPPLPPSFDRKLVVIRETRGEPVPTDVSRRLSNDEYRGARKDLPVRSADRDEILLKPRSDVDSSRRPQALPAPSERPVRRDDRPASGLGETRPTPPAEPRRGFEPVRPGEIVRPQEPSQPSQPVRPATEPRRGDVPNVRPTREVPSEPRSGWQQEAVPSRVVPTPRTERVEPQSPPVRSFDRPEPTPAPRRERVLVPEPRVEKPEPPREPTPPAAVRREVGRSEPMVDVPRRGETREPAEVRPVRVSPEKVEPQKAAPAKDAPKAKPAPVSTPEGERRRVDLEKPNG